MNEGNDEVYGLVNALIDAAAIVTFNGRPWEAKLAKDALQSLDFTEVSVRSQSGRGILVDISTLRWDVITTHGKHNWSSEVGALRAALKEVPAEHRPDVHGVGPRPDTDGDKS